MREDIEMAFIRELSTGGLILSGEISPEDRRERIRIAIHQRGLKDLMFEPGMSYGQAFEICFRRSVEMRRLQRDSTTRFQRVPDPGDDDAGEEDEDEGAKQSNTAA
jgi:hypothetical protein